MQQKYSERYINKLLQKVIYKKTYPIIKTIRDENMFNKMEFSADFEVFHDYLGSHKVLTLHQKLFRNLKLYSGYDFKLKPKDFLVLFHIIYFNDLEETHDLYLISKKLLNHFYNYEKYNKFFLRSFIELLKLYEEEYFKWKIQDKERVLGDLCKTYWEYEFVYELEKEHIPEEQHTMVREDIQRNQTRVFSLIEKIEGGKEFFESFIPVFVDEKMQSLVKEKLTLAYFDKIKLELIGTETERPFTVSFLGELKDRIRAIVPPIFDVPLDLDEVLDLDFLLLQDKETVLNSLTVFYKMMVDMDCEDNNESNVEFFDKLKKDMEESETKEKFIGLMLDGFKKTIAIIEDIQEKIMLLAEYFGIKTN